MTLNRAITKIKVYKNLLEKFFKVSCRLKDPERQSSQEEKGQQRGGNSKSIDDFMYSLEVPLYTAAK